MTFHLDTTAALTPDEIVFLTRALPHFLAGKSVAESMAAVLENDARLIASAFDRATSNFFNTPDERGRSYAGPQRPGDVISSQMSSAVWSRIRSEVSPNPPVNP